MKPKRCPASLLAQRILDAQGYLVVSSYTEYRIGEVRPMIRVPGSKEGKLKAAVVIVGTATSEEYLQQHKRFAPAGIPEPHGKALFYWRVIAE